LLLLFLALIIGCQSRSYTFFAFSFPPESVPHESGWTHIGKVVVWTQPGRNFIERYEKEIVILVEDTERNTLLEDRIKVVAGSIESKISWNRFEELEIVLYENLNNSSEDSSGTSSLNELVILSYRFNHANNRFERVKA
jgi:hypothetical protein